MDYFIHMLLYFLRLEEYFSVIKCTFYIIDCVQGLEFFHCKFYIIGLEKNHFGPKSILLCTNRKWGFLQWTQSWMGGPTIYLYNFWTFILTEFSGWLRDFSQKLRREMQGCFRWIGSWGRELAFNVLYLNKSLAAEVSLCAGSVAIIMKIPTTYSRCNAKANYNFWIFLSLLLLISKINHVSLWLQFSSRHL